ncbi:hypothetical protein [Mycolicibacterium nivoides]|uniref:Uncharacterized protein n=1 Tax=Mycolicibacterium nivoides TaxID=2487344 RepID=A0ABW9LP32_9MYCO
MSNRRRDWTAYGMPQIASRLGRLSLGFIETTPSPGAGTDDSREMLTGESPTLYWASKATVDVAIGLAANGVPNHSFAELLRSSDIASCGLMCFEKPLGSAGWKASSGEEVTVPWDAVMWGPITDTRFEQLEDRPIYIALLSRMAQHRDLLHPDERQVPLQKLDVLITTSNHPLSEGSEHWTEGTEGEVDESMSTVLNTTTALLTSVLLTAGQPRITAQRVVGIDEGVVAARRTRKEDKHIEPEVVLIDVLRPPGASGDQRSTAKRKDFDHRWWVRGHWKMQPYGPGRLLRKIIYIEPHTAGPDDKPLSKRPRVNVIRTAGPPPPAGDN